jgi:hypothetical protein
VIKLILNILIVLSHFLNVYIFNERKPESLILADSRSRVI